MLQLCSLLDSNGIPYPALTAPATLHWLTQASHDHVAPDDLHDAVRNLHRLNLLTHDPDNPTRSVRVHALVQRATAEQMTAEHRTGAALAVADALAEIWPDIETDPDLGQVLRANTAVLAAAEPDPLWTPTGSHDVLFNAGNSLGKIGQVSAAAHYFHQLHTTAHTRLGPDHPSTLTTRHNLAHWRGEAGDPGGAVTASEQLLADRLRVLGPDHPSTLTTRHNLARWRGEAGDPGGAVATFEQLLADRLRVLGPDHPATLTTRHSLARWRGEAGDLGGAVATFEQLLADRLRVLGPDHPSTLATRHSLAYWRGEAGDPAGAVATFEQLLPDRLRVMGPDHPETLTARHHLAYMRGRAGDPAGAVAGFEQLLVDRLRVLGPDHSCHPDHPWQSRLLAWPVTRPRARASCRPGHATPERRSTSQRFMAFSSYLRRWADAAH